MHDVKTHEEKTIQGLTFQLSMLAGRPALEEFHKLLRICGPGVFEALKLWATLKKGEKPDTNALFAVGGGVFSALTRAETAEVTALRDALLTPCRVKQDGKWVQLMDVYDVVLQGRIWVQVNLLAWAVQFNFADFFAGLANAASGPGDALPAARSSAPPT